MTLRDVPQLAGWLLLLAVLAGLAERAWPMLDVVAAFRLHLAVAAGGLAALAVGFGFWGTAFPTLLAAGIAAATLGPVWQPEARPAAAAGTPVRLLAANLYYWNADPAAVVRAVAALDPDIVISVETTRAMAEGPEGLASRYPYAVLAPSGTVRTAIFSRFPIEKGEVNLADGRGPLAALGEIRIAPDTRLGLIGVHFLRSAAGKRDRQLAGLERLAASLDAPLAVAGDFNAAPWTSLVAAAAARTGTTIPGGHRVTWRGRYPGVDWAEPYGHQIDHVLADPRIGIASLRAVPLPGSDHLGLMAELIVPPNDAGGLVAAEDGRTEETQ